jgi:hypothetical protein
VFTFLSAFFQSTIEFISIGSEHLSLLVMDCAKTGMGTCVPILEKNTITECQYWYGRLASAHTGNERHHGNANTGTGT